MHQSASSLNQPTGPGENPARKPIDMAKAGQVLQLIRTAGPITAAQICDKVGFGRNDQRIRDIVKMFRRKGYFICTNSKGYFLSDDPKLILEEIESLRSRGSDIMLTADVMTTHLMTLMSPAVLRMGDQMDVFGEEGINV